MQPEFARALLRQAKHPGLGREYPLAGADPVSPETLECISSLCAAAGLIDYEIAMDA